MKRLLLILIALCVAVPSYADDFMYFKKKAAGGGGPFSATDNFNRTENPLATDNWATVTSCSNLRTQDGIKASGTTGSVWNAAYWKNGTPSINQYSQTVALNASAGNFGGPAVRMSTSANTYYVLGIMGTYWRIDKFIAGAQTTVVSAQTRTNNDGETWKLTASGTTTTTLEVFVGGGSLGTFNDTTNPIYSGDLRPGLASYDYGAYWDDWVGGDL